MVKIVNKCILSILVYSPFIDKQCNISLQPLTKLYS